MLRITATLSLLLLLSASPAAAQTAGASATLEMRQSLTVGTARTMQPSGDAAVSQVRLEDNAYQISGDPNRTYRVGAVTADGEPTPIIRSDNAGEIPDGGVAFLDAMGRDTIRIAPARASAGTGGPQSVSLTIDYE